MEEKNELGDIILNKNSKEGGNKKIIFAAATLGVILIVVVLLMNSLNSENDNNLPQATLPPKPATITEKEPKEEPLFEDVEVVDETAQDEDEKLEKIAQKLKEESVQESTIEEVKQQRVKKKPKVVAVKESKKVNSTKKPVHKKASHGRYYVQVGSFSK